LRGVVFQESTECSSFSLDVLKRVVHEEAVIYKAMVAMEGRHLYCKGCDQMQVSYQNTIRFWFLHSCTAVKGHARKVEQTIMQEDIIPFVS